MKIANKIRTASLGVLIGAIFVASSGPSFALNGMDSTPLSSIDLSSSNDSSSDKAIKEPEAVKKVVKKLSTTTEGLSVDDLNTAREAVAKLDILIDIEKRLSDLAEIRSEREEKSASALTDSLPVAAMAPPPAPSFPQPPTDFGMSNPMPASPPPPPVIDTATVDVERVVGASGRYVAMIRVAGDPQKQVRVGDKISDGSTVESISPLGVTFSKDKKHRTIQINNPAPVFGAKK